MIRHFDYRHLYKNYSQFENSNFLDRYINYNDFENYLVKELKPMFQHEVIGLSESGQSIHCLNLGNGSQKILIWSQMHGNESTTTKSILDVLNFIRYNKSHSFVNYLLKSCVIKIIPILNPDGANRYTRFNINDVDLNRDAIKRSQSETQCFFKCLENFKPDYCFNMHGQRTIFSAGDTNKSAALSFLAPSYNYGLNINKNRDEAMRLIVSATKLLSDYIPGHIGRYDDAHNPNCFGDHIQNMGASTVLFEAGHYKIDYKRNEVRRFVMLSLLKMIEGIAYSNIDENNIDEYNNIPKNKKLFLDIIIKNVANSKTGFVGVQYKEVLNKNRIVFKPYIKSLGNLSDFYAHRYIEANHNPITINGNPRLKVDLNIENIKISDKNIDLKIDK